MPPSWKNDVRGRQVLPLIELDFRIIKVEAGPGTGKTFGLVRRVERIMHPEGLAVCGRDILIVAFNRVIAKQLESEIQARLETFEHNGQPVIRTIHALCLQVVGEDLRILLPHEREAMVYDLLTSHDALQARYRSLDEAEQALRDHEARVEDHLALWQAARQWLTRHSAQLISDLPGLFLDRLHAGDLEEHRFAHVIVDEFQDLTAGEQDLMFRLCREDGQIVVLGDPRQSIYRFRGNDLQGLARIVALVPDPAGLADIRMQDCQRCPRPIVIAANRLMALAGPNEMVAVSDIPGNIHVVVWESIEGEAEGMARAVIENFRANPRDKHLVMATRRRFGYLFRDRVAELAPDLTVELNFSESILETWAVREAFLFFSLAVDPDAPTWRAWLGYQNSATGREYKAPRRNSVAYLRLLAENNDVINEVAVRTLAAEPRLARRGGGGAALWDRANRFVTLREGIPEVLEPADFLNTVFNPEMWVGREYVDDATARFDMDLLRTSAINILAEARERNAHLTAEQLLAQVARRLRYAVGTREQFIEERPCEIQVATLWGAKGVTADHVYILGACKEALPGQKREEYPGTEAEYIEEQRRLFYVSITRTKRTLVISRARRISRTEAIKLGLSIENAPGRMITLTMSPFMQDIIRLLPEAVRGQNWPGCAG
jgi:DNA helicase-2/ATP-dependent DNA helicase PcrA